MSHIRWEIVPVLAETNLNASKAAEKLFLHKSTIKYHSDRVFEKTGLDPTKFYDLAKLLSMIKTEENAEWQEARMRMANIDEQTMDALERIGVKTHGWCKNE